MRILFIYILVLFSLICDAQDNNEHLSFMGFPINGTSEVFIKNLENKGFKELDTFENLTTLYGKFANEIVTLKILSSPRTHTVCKVIVIFPQKDVWKDLKSDYFKKKNLYLSKYILDQDFEFFSSPYDDGDGYELQAIKRDKCNYISFFKDIGGYITIQISKDNCIQVTYEDSNNTIIAKQELEASAFDDI